MNVISDLSSGAFRRAFPVLLGGLLAAGCAPREIAAESLAATAVRDSCPAAQVQALAGHAFTALADVPLPDGLRILRPGQTVTRDLQPLRLNAQVDDAGRILRLFCG